MTSPAIQEAAKQLAGQFGYHFGVLTDGTIVLEPPADPECCKSCAVKAQWGSDVIQYDITVHQSELIPGGQGAVLGTSDDHPGKQFLIIPESASDQ